MIERRSIIIGICGLVAAPILMRTRSNLPIVVDPVAGPAATSTLFTIHGWSRTELGRAEAAVEHIVALHLPDSWRAAWL